jgi:hypothetical protein
MPTFECNGLIDPKNMKVHKIVYNNFVLNGLTNPMNFNSNKMNFNSNKMNFNSNKMNFISNKIIYILNDTKQ